MDNSSGPLSVYKGSQMSQPHKTAEIDYAQVSFDADGTPESSGFGDIYFHRAQGIAESSYVFLEQNRLRDRFYTWATHRPFVIAETGFGTGLNCLLAAALFLDVAPANARLHIVSVEAYPLTPSDLQHALAIASALAPQLQPLVQQLLSAYPPPIRGTHRIHLHDRVTLDLMLGDVLDCFPEWSQDNRNSVDAWFLDGFAPQKNPQMWQPQLYRAIARSLRVHGTLATFTATGHVRRGLQNVGMQMHKVPGFGSKRDMLVGSMQRIGDPEPDTELTHIAIIGNGIAGANLAWSLRHFPGDMTIIGEQEPASGASGNPQGAVYPLLQANWTPTSAFYSSAFVYARQRYLSLTPEYSHFQGLIDYVSNTKQYPRLRKMKNIAGYPKALFTARTAAQLAQHTKVPIGLAGGHHPLAGWIEPAATVNALLQCTIRFRQQQGRVTHTCFQHQVTRVSRAGQQWAIEYEHHPALTVSHVVIANGERVPELLPQTTIPIRPVRGQITRVRASHSSLSGLSQVLCRGGYVVPALDGAVCIGATFDKSRADAKLLDTDHDKNIEMLHEQFGISCTRTDVIDGRASVRATTPDHLPVAGALQQGDDASGCWQPLPNIYLLSGLGARGLTSAPLAAELIASRILQQPAPIARHLQESLCPMRFAKRAQVKGLSPFSVR
ncbi:bifunctional tRNA (5-methylaminomethyl-2-thiouridine)(34)-methyltransferase MnmD/FAD-dependent 5-carboxymethylaminomethyl-2-thiouridine(34) oxidoreductase MnmC [Aliidiomarina halalkaliphila]|uniref:tRNA 5-methylaminomethyl-2-thiouridine biosynthesis bifunctional protein MnmC n=2 Tax=Aliidiomarina halalkaliphila TaxID=2593535 RepID=A0A552X2S0_9GAMM|nr:bifunctional tRNA (5-methylaminomethyl-2-thiouridine)(34)-methyltransferase MnmD/FAD-dependent 5-carboxymethylaminomethyl-2-thiouridine(34) oxidoreductase MnmC [Aliidiomarina halalkaliphila]